MPRLIDMLRCDKCGTWYVPKFTPTGRVQPHCLEIPKQIVHGSLTGWWPYSEAAGVRGLLVDEEV